MKWSCREKCGECCGPVLLPARTVHRFRDHFERQPVREVRVGNSCLVICEDLSCVFLERKTRKCRIYSHRPTICRKYGIIPGLPCPYIAPEGSPRAPAEVEVMKRAIDAKVDGQIAAILGAYPCHS